MNGKNEISVIKLADVIPSPDNPRHLKKDDPKVMELAESIKHSGLWSPVICRPHPQQKGKYDLRAGFRRFLAHQALKMDTILAIVSEMDDKVAMDVTVLENLQREDLSPIEEAGGVNSMLKAGRAAEDIAASIGKSITWVYRRAKLVDLISKFKEAIEDQKKPWCGVTAAHLELIARLPEDRQAEIFKAEWLANRSVKEFAERLAEEEHMLSVARWDLDDAVLANMQACSACVKRSGAAPELFHDSAQAAKKKDRCLDVKCWLAKQVAFIERRKAELAASADKTVVLIHSEDADYGEQKAQKGALDRWDYERAKETAPGAKLALVVDGKDAGKEVWIKTNALANGAGEKSRMPPLALRRNAHVIRAVDKALATCVCPFKSLFTAASFVAIFGTDDHAVYCDKKEWKSIDTDFSSDEPLLIETLWKKLKPVLEKRMQLFDVSGCWPKYEEALRVAGLIGLKAADLDKAAVEAIPDKGKTEHRQLPDGKRNKGAAPKANKGKTQTDGKERADRDGESKTPDASPNNKAVSVAVTEDVLKLATTIIQESQRASVSLLQRRMKLGYTAAAQVMDQLEENGIVGPARGSEPREILIEKDAEKEGDAGKKTDVGRQTPDAGNAADPCGACKAAHPDCDDCCAKCLTRCEYVQRCQKKTAATGSKNGPF